MVLSAMWSLEASAEVKSTLLGVEVTTFPSSAITVHAVTSFKPETMLLIPTSTILQKGAKKSNATHNNSVNIMVKKDGVTASCHVMRRFDVAKQASSASGQMSQKEKQSFIPAFWAIKGVEKKSDANMVLGSVTQDGVTFQIIKNFKDIAADTELKVLIN